MIRFILSLLLLGHLHLGYAAQEPVAFEQPEQYQRYQGLTQQLRCLVCQNQTIADSNAPLAQDLRQEVAKLIRQHHSDAQIIEFLTKRYGQFILYKPQLTQQTWLLWFGPFLLLAVAFGVLLAVISRRKKLTRVNEAPL